MISCLRNFFFLRLEKQYNTNLKFCMQFKKIQIAFIRLSNKIKYIVKAFNLRLLDYLLYVSYHMCSFFVFARFNELLNDLYKKKIAT